MKKWMGLGLALLLAGCSSVSQPSMRSYVLPSNIAALSGAVNATRPLLVVPPVVLSPLLSGNGLVYQTSPTEVMQAQHNVWAESIGSQLTQMITGQLRVKQQYYWTTDLAAKMTSVNASRLVIKFTHFNGKFTGVAQLTGEWLLVSSKGQVNVIHPFSFNVPLAKDGYPALVVALAQGVDRLTTEIATSLSLRYP